MRFYAELNDFLPKERRFTTFELEVTETQSVKDVLESCGVPHAEIDLVVVDGASVTFDHLVSNGERIAAYPVFEGLDISPIIRLRPEPLRDTRLVVDANLGRLSRLLRLFGFDALYKNDFTDEEVVEIAVVQNRIILTRDRRLLMRRAVTHGFYIRSTKPIDQLTETIHRLDLADQIKPLSRCTDCNGIIHSVDKSIIARRLPHYTRRSYTKFLQCATCGKLYWQGAHWTNLQSLIAEVKTTVASRRS